MHGFIDYIASKYNLWWIIDTEYAYDWDTDDADAYTLASYVP